MYVCIFAVAIFTIPVELGSEYPEFFKTQNFVSLNFVSISWLNVPSAKLAEIASAKSGIYRVAICLIFSYFMSFESLWMYLKEVLKISQFHYLNPI